MKYTEQVDNAIWEYNRKHQFPANVVGMTSAMQELIEKEIGAQGVLVSFHGINVEMNNISEKPLFWIGGIVEFHTPKEPVDPASVQKALEVHISGIRACRSDGCPYIDEYPDKCTMHLCKDALEVINELRGSKR